MPFPGLLVSPWRESKQSHKWLYKINLPKMKKTFPNVLTSLHIHPLKFFPPLFLAKACLGLTWWGKWSVPNFDSSQDEKGGEGDYCVFTPWKRCINSSIRNIKLQEVSAWWLCWGGLRGPLSSQAGKLRWNGVVLSVINLLLVEARLSPEL